MITKKPQKKNSFCCEICQFITANKKDFDRHNATRKHTEGVKWYKDDNSFTPKHICECGKIYNFISGLSRHKKTCKIQENFTPNHTKKETNINNYDDVKSLTNLVLDVVKQNHEITNKNQELQKQLLEICKNGTNNITNSQINSNNKTFNLQIFLNEQCKDAMNIMDFVDSLKIQLTDLENVGKLGFVDGLSNIIVKNLQALDVTKRPVHCSDSKREILYIKDENKWEKENEERKKLKKVIKQIADKNCKLIPEWKAKYPECINSNSVKSDEYNKIIVESMGGFDINDSIVENKIIKKIVKEITIDKEVSVDKEEN
jgi:hypothetical protein